MNTNITPRIRTQKFGNMRLDTRSNTRSKKRGFTIVELMVVVSLIAFFVTASIPLLLQIDSLTRDRSGVNTIGVAVTAARAYATRDVADKDDLGPNADGFSGAIIVFAPNNELRIAQDVQNKSIEDSGQSAFADILRTEPISMPRGQGVVGISRTGSGLAGFVIVPPPFAVRFDNEGHLVSSMDTNSRFSVIYDGDLDGSFGGGPVAANFDPSPFDPDLATPDQYKAKFNAGESKYQICECDRFPSVIGVIVYSKADFEDAGGRFPGTKPAIGCDDGDCANIAEWMFDNGRTLFFSRYTGAIIRDNAP